MLFLCRSRTTSPRDTSATTSRPRSATTKLPLVSHITRPLFTRHLLSSAFNISDLLCPIASCSAVLKLVLLKLTRFFALISLLTLVNVNTRPIAQNFYLDSQNRLRYTSQALLPFQLRQPLFLRLCLSFSCYSLSLCTRIQRRTNIDESCAEAPLQNASW